jgi:hypothetical protein
MATAYCCIIDAIKGGCHAWELAETSLQCLYVVTLGTRVNPQWSGMEHWWGLRTQEGLFDSTHQTFGY